MDAKSFDRLARRLSAGTTRRLVLVAASMFWPMLDAAAKKGHGQKKKKGKCRPKCKECTKCSGKRCKPGPDGTACSRGQCRDGDCLADSTCSISGNDARLVTESTFAGKPLRLLQTTPFDPDAAPDKAGLTQSEVTLDGAPLLHIAQEIGNILGQSVVITTVTYGAAFQGIEQATFYTDGQTIAGEIDGRAIQPLDAGDDYSQLAFLLGGPALVVQVDPGLVDALQGLFRQAKAQADTCKPAQRTRRGNDRIIIADLPACAAEMAKCASTGYECESAAIATALSTCNIVPIVGPIVCGVVGTGICAKEAGDCFKAARYGPKCCPVACGGSLSILAGWPLCCEEGQTCRDPQDNLVCCNAGTSGCHGTCCPNGSCVGNICCTPGVGKICGSQCCAPLDSCCGGAVCCSGTCNGGQCCPAPNSICGSSCSPPDRACCPFARSYCDEGEYCDDNDQCATPVGCTFMCGSNCCHAELGHEVCCGSSNRCSSRLNCPA